MGFALLNPSYGISSAAFGSDRSDAGEFAADLFRRPVKRPRQNRSQMHSEIPGHNDHDDDHADDIKDHCFSPPIATS
jgi:hypothetical protein